MSTTGEMTTTSLSEACQKNVRFSDNMKIAGSFIHKGIKDRQKHFQALITRLKLKIYPKKETKQDIIPGINFPIESGSQRQTEFSFVYEGKLEGKSSTRFTKRADSEKRPGIFETLYSMNTQKSPVKEKK